MIKGRKLTDKESQCIILDEIDKATTLPENFDEIIKPFLLNNNKCVSTIGDECSRVGLEIGTSSKRKAIDEISIEDIVSTSGDRG